MNGCFGVRCGEISPVFPEKETHFVPLFSRLVDQEMSRVFSGENNSLDACVCQYLYRVLALCRSEDIYTSEIKFQQ